MRSTVLNTRTRTTRRSLQEGQAIVLIALLILVMFGMLGLAIDSGRGYVDRRDQQTAVDAAALAAGDWYENYPDTTDLWGKVIPQSVVVYENNLRIYTGTDNPIPAAPFTRTVGIAPNLYTQYEWDLTFLNGSYSLTILATNTQFNGYEFEYKTSHNLPLAFIQVFGGSPTIVVGADATSIVGNQRQTPALLTLSTGPCATRLQGAGTLTMLGDAYTNGQACVDANLHLAGNCYAVDPTSNCANAAYYCYGPTNPPYPPTGGACNPGDVLGGPIQPAPSLPDPGYLSPSVGAYNFAGNSYNRGNWTEMTPGTWNNFSLSSGGCYFLDAGIYQWYGGYTSHGALVSNELKPPGEVLYTQPGTGTAPPTQFWGGQGCTGGFTLAAVPAAPGAGIKHNGPGSGLWGIELTSGRYDQFTDASYSGNACLSAPGCWRESAPSACQSLNEIDGNNQAIDVTITSNAPGAEYYSVYINPNGCVGQYGGGTRKDFSYYGTFLAPGWTDAGPGTTPTSPGIGPWIGILGNGRYGWTPSCTNPLVTICGLNTNTFPATSHQCPFYNTLTTGCAAPWDEATPHCFLTCALNTVPQDNSPMTLQYPPYNGGDLANENLCQYTPVSPSGDPNQPCTAAKVTPGAVQFYFPVGNNCLDQNGNGSTHVFSGEQYNWIVIYQQPSTAPTAPATYCPSQKLNGNAFTQYIGTIYSPTSGWDILGSDTSPVAGQVIAWTATVTGSGNTGIDFNPNYSPAPPAARLIN